MDKQLYLQPDTVLTERDWQDAYLVQNASNLSGVVRSWGDVMGRIWAEARAHEYGTDWVNRHPINLLYADKCAQLAGCQNGMSDEALWAAYDVQRQKTGRA